MFVKAASVLGLLLLLLKNTETGNCPRCGDKVKLRTLFQKDDPMIARRFGQFIRPKAIQKPPYNLPLYESSFKGPCFKRTVIVKPAIVPRPIYVQPDCTTEVGTNDSELAAAAAAAAEMLTQLSQSNNVNPPSANLGPAIDVSKAYQQALAGAKPSVPADAVSLALAYQMYQDNFNKKDFEDRLTYGFRKLPVEKSKPAKSFASPISESNLYSFNGQVVELKPIPEEDFADSLSAEAMDELVDLACYTEMSKANFVKTPSLMDLGYVPAQLTKAAFIDIPPSNSPSASESSLINEESPTSSETAVSSEPSSEISESPEIPTSSMQSDSLSDTRPVLFPALRSMSSEPKAIPNLVTSITVPVKENATKKLECPEPVGLLPPPLVIEGFKPGKVIYKDFTDSEDEETSPNSEIPCESQEEVVRHVPVPATPCGCQLEDLLEKIRTYSKSRASNSGSRSTPRISYIKKHR